MRTKRVLQIVVVLAMALAVPMMAQAQSKGQILHVIHDLKNRVTALETALAAAQENITALQSALAEAQSGSVLGLRGKGRFVRFVRGEINGLPGPHLIFEGLNVHIRSGSGATDDNGTLTGLGNLVVGYNEEPNVTGVPYDPLADRTGSHNLIVGKEHKYRSFSGLVAGFQNTIGGEAPSVSGGRRNDALGDFASVSGGSFNTASGLESSVSGGQGNSVSGETASVSGGFANIATGTQASVSGGLFNQATGPGAGSSISGGRYNKSSGLGSSVSGGENNEASGDWATVSGGFERIAPGEHDWCAGNLCEDF